jgi:hypothetical protein
VAIPTFCERILRQSENTNSPERSKLGNVWINKQDKCVLIFRDMPQFVALGDAYWLYLPQRAGILSSLEFSPN